MKSSTTHTTLTMVFCVGLPDRSSASSSKLNSEHCPIPTIFITAHGDEKMRLRAMRSGAGNLWLILLIAQFLLESVPAALDE
jgi:FixJ family two-component response regulator